MEFPCTGCSLCCRTVRHIHTSALNYPEESIVYKAAEAFPYSWNEDGSCVMLKDNLCSVYQDRPLLCNVRELGNLIAQETGSDLNTVYEIVANSCNDLISAYNLNRSFMIDAGQFQ